jgi:hypothetical protein
MADFKKIDLTKTKTYSIKNRASRVRLDLFGKPLPSKASFNELLDSLPKFLKAEDFRRLVERITKAIEKDKRCLFMIGAHTLKVGLSPLFIDFMDYYKNLHFAGNAAVSIHDLEIAFFGATSEDVLENLQDGSFGFVVETAELYAEVLKNAAARQIGLGQSLGEIITDKNAAYKEYSLAYNCLKRNIPLTIHAAIGTDIVNQHSVFDGAACGEASYTDFKIFANSVSEIAGGGVALNIGSAVIMPEVFLKAIAICRNLNQDFGGFTTANIDMLSHYRPAQNVVNRTAALNSEGYNIIGHHEIMIPLLLAAVKNSML